MVDSVQERLLLAEEEEVVVGEVDQLLLGVFAEVVQAWVQRVCSDAQIEICERAFVVELLGNTEVLR